MYLYAQYNVSKINIYVKNPYICIVIFFNLNKFNGKKLHTKNP